MEYKDYQISDVKSLLLLDILDIQKEILNELKNNKTTVIQSVSPENIENVEKQINELIINNQNETEMNSVKTQVNKVQNKVSKPKRKKTTKNG